MNSDELNDEDNEESSSTARNVEFNQTPSIHNSTSRNVEISSIFRNMIQ